MDDNIVVSRDPRLAGSNAVAAEPLQRDAQAGTAAADEPCPATPAEAPAGNDSLHAQQTAPLAQQTDEPQNNGHAAAALSSGLSQPSDATGDTQMRSAEAAAPASSARTEVSDQGRDLRCWPGWVTERQRLNIQAVFLRAVLLNRAIAGKRPPTQLRLFAGHDAEARGNGHDIEHSGRNWAVLIKRSAFAAVSAALAAHLPQPCSELPADTRVSLTAGSTAGHIIVQLAPPDMPDDGQLAAAAAELLSASAGPAFRRRQAGSQAVQDDDSGAAASSSAPADSSSSGSGSGADSEAAARQPPPQAADSGDSRRAAEAGHATAHVYLRADAPDARAILSERQLLDLFSGGDMPPVVDLYMRGASSPCTARVRPSNSLEVPKPARVQLQQRLLQLAADEERGSTDTVVFRRIRLPGGQLRPAALSMRPLGAHEDAAAAQRAAGGARETAGPSAGPSSGAAKQHGRNRVRAEAAQATAVTGAADGGGAARATAALPRSGPSAAPSPATAKPRKRKRLAAINAAAAGAAAAAPGHAAGPGAAVPAPATPSQRDSPAVSAKQPAAAGGSPQQRAPGQQSAQLALLAPAGVATDDPDQQLQAKLAAICSHAASAIQQMRPGWQPAPGDLMLQAWKAVAQSAKAIAPAAPPP